MATATSRKRFTNAFSVKPRRFFPSRLKTPAHGQTNDFRHCPVCGHGFSTIDRVANGPDTDAQRLEEFFARFS